MTERPPAERALGFIQHLPQTKGKWAGRRLKLMEWQKKPLRKLLGTFNEDGNRQYRTTFWFVPRKNGKSTVAAAVALYLLLADREGGPEVYGAAFDREQASIVFDQALAMLNAAPPGMLPAWKDYKREKRIVLPGRNAKYEAISAEAAGSHGYNAHGIIFDEFHTQRDRELWDVLRTSVGSREQPLTFVITTAGFDRDSPCYELYEYAKKVDEGTIDDPTFLPVIYEADEEDDWTEPETWAKANPGLGTTISYEYIERECLRAQEQPSYQNTFKRLHLNLWTQQATRWIMPRDWDLCERSYTEEEMVGAECYGGLDLGAVDDLTAWLLAFPDRDDPERVRFLCRAWCPEARLYDRSNPYREQYQVWAREGWLKTVDGNVMDYGPVRRQIVEDSRAFGLVDLAVDTAFQGNQLMVELSEDHGLEVLGMRTTYNHMTSPCDEFERRIRMATPKIHHNGNPVLKWAVSNVALKQPDPDRKRPVKDAEDAKIDPVVAALMALDRAMRHEDARQTPDLFVLG